MERTQTQYKERRRRQRRQRRWSDGLAQRSRLPTVAFSSWSDGGDRGDGADAGATHADRRRREHAEP
ncbi:hypothetical protein NL676_003807 [Syzygium grande]|nr:hypothetical protein NL676_003807 [Syzygium grande]